MSPVVTGAVVPIQGVLNSTLAAVNVIGNVPLISGALGVLGFNPPPAASVDVAGLLATAAAGDPITLSVLDVNGVIVGPTDDCIMTADGVTLDTEKGVSIGGNQVTGLGANGQEADAGEINSIAIGNNAETDASATSSIALGTGATVGANATGSIAIGAGAGVTAANSVAIGAGSQTTAILSNPAYNPGLGAIAGSTAAGEFSVGNASIQRRVTNVAAGSASTDAVNVSQLEGLAQWSIRYDAVAKDHITLEGPAGTTIANLADGVVNATSDEAVNGSQLFGVSQSVVNHLGGGTVNVDGTVTGPTYVIQGGNHTTISSAFSAVDGEITNVNTRIDNIDSAVNEVSDRAVRYDGAEGDAKDTITLEGSNGTTIRNLADGEISATSGDAVNGSQLHGASQSVADHLGGGATVSSDGTVNGPTYTIQGSDYGTVYNAFEAVDSEVTNINTRIDNIDTSIGEVTDRAVRYDGIEGAAKDTITLEGASGTTITNLRPALLDETSTDAVNGSQLHDTNVALAELSDNAVQYDLDLSGNKTNTVTLLGGDPNAPVVLKNVAAGVDQTDAVNLAQLEGGLADVLIQANTYSDTLLFNANEEVINIANEYTDMRISQLSGEISGVRDEARLAAAIGLAASSIRYDDTPGKFSIGVGGGLWRGQSATAFGAGYTSEGGRVRANAAATMADGSVGGGAGLSITLN
ncbi:MAG: YadA-like family protein [Mesorhizobium sp.]|nr:YadA-like family protein [Mesorhizobium sp.]MBL8577739.1 YadA-like family protein [Mesorhizobium sp.]